MRFKVLKEKTVFDSKLKILEGEIGDGIEPTFSRLCLKREDASVVLILNTDSNKVVLTKQFRYPITAKVQDEILEIVAGKVDEGEEPLTTAIRETEEETGYIIRPGQIKFLFSCFASPGYSSERFFVYYATVTNQDKKAKGGGLEIENEHIEVVEIDVNEFNTSIRNGDIKDAKTYLAGLYLLSLK
ncbi:MAG: NUDIX hydrolase [Bacteroidota bacterium]